jgi:hypothetical protein
MRASRRVRQARKERVMSTAFTLGKAQIGDRLKLSQRGGVWTVIHKHDGREFASVIQIRNAKGTTRTYTDKDEIWTNQVWYV